MKKYLTIIFIAYTLYAVNLLIRFAITINLKGVSMINQILSRKALALLGLFFFRLFSMAEGSAVFTQSPAVAKQGDSAVVITFTVSESTDVEVGIVDSASGKIINHLAAGVLGGTYPPPAPLVAGLSQSIVWNYRDDDGVLKTDSVYKVRVRLGVKPKFVWKKVTGHSWMASYDRGYYYGDRREWQTLKLGGEGGYGSIGNITQIPAKYNNGAYVTTIMQMGWWYAPDSGIMVLLKREADFFVGARDDLPKDPFLSRYTDTGDSIIAGSTSATYSIYKAHGQTGDRFYLPNGFQWDGSPSCFCFVEADAYVEEALDPWNTNPQTDFLCKWHPLMTGTQTPYQMMLNSEPEGDVFSIKGGSTTINRCDASTGIPIKTMDLPWENEVEGISQFGPGNFFAYDGKEQVIYINNPCGYSFNGSFGYLWRYNMSDFSPAPWPQTGKSYVGPFSHFPDNQLSNWEGGDKGTAVGPDGLVYVNSIEDTISNFDWTSISRMLVVSVIKDGAIIDKSRIRLDAWFAGLKVDRKGNIFVGAKVKPKGQSPSEVAPGSSQTEMGTVTSFMGSILKFPNTGGTVRAALEGDYDFETCVGSYPRKSSGLEWCYYGLSKFCGFDNTCWCSVCNFDLDKWGRLFLPNSMQAEMAALDNNRNIIYKIKNREMPEAGGIIPGNIAVTENYVVVSDWMQGTCSGFRLDAQSTWFVNIATGEPYNNVENKSNANAVASISTWPNPFVSSIGFKYVIPANMNGPVNLGVYDLQGRLIRELVNSSRTSGVYNIHWDGIDAKGAAISNGVYVYRFKTNGHTVVGRIAVLR